MSEEPSSDGAKPQRRSVSCAHKLIKLRIGSPWRGFGLRLWMHAATHPELDNEILTSSPTRLSTYMYNLILNQI